jgi:hypothetical protein
LIKTGFIPKLTPKTTFLKLNLSMIR